MGALSVDVAVDVAVVGAGISGLVVASRLQAAGRTVAVLEGASEPGGVIRSLPWQGSTVERGPTSFLATAELRALIAELGLAGEVLEPAPAARARYVLRDGELRPVPLSPGAFLASPLLSAGGKLRLLLEPLRHGRRPEGDESVRAFVERHLGPEAYRYLALPFVGGVYAGDPERLSVRAAFPALAGLEREHPSLLVAAILRALAGRRERREPRRRSHASVCFRGGNDTLPTALGAALGAALRLATAVREVEPRGDGFRVALADGDEVEARTVVLALRARAASSLVRAASSALAEALSGFREAAVAVVHTQVPATSLLRPLDGFGFLVPRGEGIRQLGSIWSSALFPSRVAAGRALFATFLGGALDPEAARLPEGEALALVDRELRALGIYRDPPEAQRKDAEPSWIAQYDLGHEERVAAAEAEAARLGRLYLAGSSYRGVAVGDCIRDAEAVASRVLAGHPVATAPAIIAGPRGRSRGKEASLEPISIKARRMGAPPRFAPSALLWLVLVGVGALCAWTSWFEVGAESVGVVLRLGAFNRTVDPGLNFKLPLGIETVLKVETERQLKDEFGFRTREAGVTTSYEPQHHPEESQMLTGDLNVAVVEWIVQYRVTDPRKYLFRVRNVRETFRYMAQAVMREVIGDRTVSEVLTVGRSEVADTVKQKLQELCEQYETGLRVEQVILQDVTPPDEVKGSFNEVNQAQQERETLINQARSEYNRDVPQAAGVAEQTVQQAEGYAVDRVNRARGEADRFRAVVAEYRKAPEVTRRRLYVETMQAVLPKAGRKLIVDKDAGNIVPLLNMGAAGPATAAAAAGGAQ